MGKPKAKKLNAKIIARKKARAALRAARRPAQETAKKYSIDDILDRAEDYVDEFNYDLGHKFCERALEMDPDNVRALSLFSSILLEKGDTLNAMYCLGHAIEVEPEDGHSKYLSFAQLFTGNEALKWYEKGLQIMNKVLVNIKDGDENSAVTRQELRREISSVHCAISELFMTDLCDAEGAEENCQKHFNAAVEADESNPEAWQTKARYLLIREKFEDCKKTMEHSLSLWLPKYQALIENKPEGDDVDPIDVCPMPYQTRLSTAKILIELEMFDEAVKVLEGLLYEDDEIVDTWYLLGWLNRLRATLPNGEEGYNGNARYYLNKAKEAHKKNPSKDAEMVKHIDELQTEIGPENANGEAEDNNESDNDDNWVDHLDSDEENEPMEQS